MPTIENSVLNIFENILIILLTGGLATLLATASGYISGWSILLKKRSGIALLGFSFSLALLLASSLFALMLFGFIFSIFGLTDDTWFAISAMLAWIFPLIIKEVSVKKNKRRIVAEYPWLQEIV